MFHIIIITCDKTKHILPISIYFLQKYMKNHKFTILGFNKPDFNLPNNFKFVSMGDKQNINTWTYDIYKYTRDITDKYLMFLLDDFFLLDKFDESNIKIIIDLMERSDYKLCNLGLAPQKTLNDKIILNSDNLLVIERDSKCLYKVNAQPSIYKTDYFNKYFNVKYNPWSFELKSKAKNDKYKTLSVSPNNRDGTKINPEKNHKPIYHTQLRSALSKQWNNKINLSGIKNEDLKYLIENKLIKQENIVYK